MPTNLHFHTILHHWFALSHNKGIQVYMRQLLIRFSGEIKHRFNELSIVSMSCKAVNKSVKKKLRLQTGFCTLASV